MDNLTVERDMEDADGNKHHYVVTKLTGRKSFYYQFKILALLGYAIKDGGIDLMNLAELEEILKTELNDISAIIGKLLYSLDDTDKIIGLITGLFIDCQVRRDSDELNNMSTFDRVFAGENIFEAYKAAKIILEINFATEKAKNFFFQAITKHKATMPKATKPTVKPKILHEESKKA